MKRIGRLASVTFMLLVIMLAITFTVAAEDYDYVMTTDESLSLSHSASCNFTYTVEDTSIAKITSQGTTSMSFGVGPWGSSISYSRTGTISPVKPGVTNVVLHDSTYGFIIGRYSLLVKEGKHQMETVKVIKKATATVDGKKEQVCKFCGLKKTVTIPKAATIKLKETSYTYNGKVKTPEVIVKNSKGKTLVKNTDYTLKYEKGRKSVGTYKVTIKMKGDYSGTKTLTFKIKPISISKCSVKLSNTSFTYDGKVKTPTVTVKNANGTKLKDIHYTVTYASGRKNVGTYKVTIKMKGNYSGTKTLTFKIVPKVASINKLTAKNKAIAVKLNRSMQQSSGYEVQYGTSDTFKNARQTTVKSYKTSLVTLSGLSAKTTYYVRVRTYKTVGNTKYYSNWCAVKSIKTK